MTKQLFSTWMKRTPETTKEKYIFISNNQSLCEAIIMAGYQSLFLDKEESENYYTADSLSKEIIKNLWGGSNFFVFTSTDKKDRELLTETFKEGFIKHHNYWKPFVDKDYLTKEEYKDELKKILNDFINQQEGPQKEEYRDSTGRFIDFIAKVQSKAYKPLKTGMNTLDQMLDGGIMKQSLVMLNAAPATGKTTLCQQLAETMAESGQPVLFINLEMSREQLLARSMSRIIHKNGGKMSAADVLKGYKWDPIQENYVKEAAYYYLDKIAPYMDYNPIGTGSELDKIIAVMDEAVKRNSEHGLPAPVVVLDYLHLVTLDQKADAQEIIKKTVTALKQYAIKNDTFVIAIGANSRAGNKGAITLESGRDSSAIEYTGDYVFALNYKAVHEGTVQTSDVDAMADLQRGNSKGHREMILQVLKNRMGEQGRLIHLNFDTVSSCFYQANNMFKFDKQTKADMEENPFIL